MEKEYKTLYFDTPNYEELRKKAEITTAVNKQHRLTIGQDVSINGFSGETRKWLPYLNCRVMQIDKHSYNQDWNMVRFVICEGDASCDRRKAIKATKAKDGN